MQRLLAIATLIFWPGLGMAQQWQFRAFDDGSFFRGDIFLSGEMNAAVLCGERSPRGLSPTQTGNMEPDVTPPGTLRINLSQALIGSAAMPGSTRDDVMIVVGSSGYRLPALRWNELFGTWETDLASTDGLFAALSSAGAAELRSAAGAQSLPVAGFATGLEQLTDYCRRMFAAVAKPWPGVAAPSAAAPAAAGSPMQEAAEASITRGCNGPAQRESSYLLVGEIDGDGVPDAVVDWRAVQCQSGIARPFCGASMCSAAVFLSTRFPAHGRPEDLLALGVKLVPLSNGNQGVSVGGSLSMCAERGSSACWFIFYWDGTRLTELR